MTTIAKKLATWMKLTTSPENPKSNVIYDTPLGIQIGTQKLNRNHGAFADTTTLDAFLLSKGLMAGDGDEALIGAPGSYALYRYLNGSWSASAGGGGVTLNNTLISTATDQAATAAMAKKLNDEKAPAGSTFANAAAFQAALNAAAAQASVVEIAAGITLHANTTYWVAMAQAPATGSSVFVNFQEARQQQSAAVMRGTYTDVGDGGRAGQVLWAYDSAQSRLYVRGVTAVAHIAVVKYAKVLIGEGTQPGPVVVPSGVHLVGRGMDNSTILSVQAIDTSIAEWPASYAAKVRPFCKLEDLTTYNLGNYGEGETLFSTSLFYPPDSNADSVILKRVRAYNMAQNAGVSRQNSVELACNAFDDGKYGRGLQWSECEFYGARSGLAVETFSFQFQGWGTFSHCKTFGHNWLDGLLNSFDHIHCTETNLTPTGEVVSLGSVTTYPGAILSGSLAPFTGKPYVLKYIGSNLTFVRASSGSLAMMVGDDTGEIVFDGSTVLCDTGPLIGVDTLSGAETILTHAKLAQFIVRNSTLPTFRSGPLAGSVRIPMGIKIQALTPVNSAAGSASIAGWIVDEAKELSKDWEFTAAFTGTFAANANNKRLVLQAGPVGALVDVLDTTSLALNAGSWEIQLTVTRSSDPYGTSAGKYRIVAVLMSTNATLTSKTNIVVGTVAAATNMQFNLQSTGVAGSDIVLGSTNIDGTN